ncbi:uncharacterized protein B0J16DRAFT_351239 [Fusarium flagelliforme]|uniref:uncharacterized protein n=1 Tax=Fusarium flagelliforme TaxID=2675880 RepID=UPI001E8DF1FB|nr:uncharacterized protein B0J16DRAFT_351239 [Fusarium flagelliforme]KAH7174023.1 hypothetical protein B0J16DRAFT_351239 [Fusarium flagelliforme]
MATTFNPMRPKVNRSDCPILRLPNEILSDILRRVIDMECDDTFDLNARPRTAVRLSNTNRYIRNILIPEIYSVFHIYHAPEVAIQQNENLRKSMSRVHEILRDNPELGRHCKTLRVTLDEPTYLWSTLAYPIIPESLFAVRGWLQNTRHLVIDGINDTNYIGFNHHVIAIIHNALKSFPGLTTLSMRGDGILLHEVLEGMRDVGECHSLSTLILDEVAPYGEDEEWDDGLREVQGTAPMQKLEFNRFDLPPKALEVLVRWPKELHSLSVRPSESQIQDDVWHWGSLQPILETQMANLRELNLYGLMLDRNLEILDLTGFTMLERLSLPATLTGFNMRDVPRILAPNLRFFEWQVSLAGYYDLFSVEHYNWVLGMVELAAQQQQKLKTIFVAVDCSNWYDLLDLNSDYPWDALKSVDMNSKRFGIRVRYDEPAISREDFEARMAELEEEERMEKRMDWTWG